MIDVEDSAEASDEPSLNDGGVESEGAENETEHDAAEHDASRLATRYPTRNRRPLDWYSTHTTH